MFSSLAKEEVAFLADYLQGYRIKAGTVVFKEADPGSFMFLLIRGEMEIYKADTSGHMQDLVNVTPGSTVGEMSIIDQQARSATCLAKEDSLVLVLSRQNFEAILDQHAPLAVQLLSRLARLLSQRLRAQNVQMADFMGGQYID
ncbi:MAG: cyclic nucleotide-binding domain-containing protein [Proteobacteria bacterium]|nr:cyclic nucleotide-binding domain-containing protein [Pseudomonadota bacterium]